MKYLTNINLNGNQLERAKFQSVATLESVSSPFAGQHVWCTGDNQEYVYDGSKWVNAMSQGDYTFGDGIKESAGRVVGLDLATGANAGNVTLSAGSDGLSASVAEASTSAKGIIEIADAEDVATGTATDKAVTPAQLANKVEKNAAITAGTHTKITYDAKGLVTAGEDLEASDIPDLDSAKVTTLASYAKGSVADIATSDTLNAALGKLEAKADEKVVANAAITGGTHTKITYDAKGLVTAGADLAESDIPDLHLDKVTDVTATAAEVNKLAGLDTTATELGYVHGVTSAIQDQLDAKVAANTAITGATKTKITYDSKGLVTAGDDLAESDIPSLHLAKITDVTADAAELNILDGATVTTTELNYLSGVTSGVQSQLNGKVDALTTGPEAGTYTKVTVTADGLVSAGASLAASDIPDISATYVTQAEKGAVSGVAELDANGKVPSSQLPSYVDDVVDLLAIADTAPAECTTGDMYYNTSSKKIFTATAEDTWSETGTDPEKGKIYVNLANNGCYRWSGSEMINITNPIGAATTTTPGIVELATDSEAIEGEDEERAVTPHALAAAMAGATVTFTNKTFDANGTGNSLSNVEVADFASGVVQTTVRASSSALDTALASEKAVRTELDTKQNLVASATANDIAFLNGDGQVIDSGKAVVTTLGPASGEGQATDAQIATAAATRAAINAAAGAAAHKEVKAFAVADATFANGQVTWAFANPLSDADVMVQVKQSDNEVVIADVDTDASTITITFNAGAMPEANAYKAVIIG